MPIDYRDYHPDWRWITRQIKEQAGDRCEFCGVANRTRYIRIGDTILERVHDDETALCRHRKCQRIVLTVAHLDHDRTNNDPANLRALCQRCHLNWDREHHATNAAKTRRRNRDAAVAATGQGVLL
jgi:hypothetical protein